MQTPPALQRPRPERQREILLVASLIVLGLLAIRLADVLLMAFAAVLVAVLLQAVAEPLQSKAGLNRTLALVLSVLTITGAIACALWVFGREAERQFASLTDLLPRAWNELQLRLNSSPIGAALLRDLQGWSGMAWFLELGPRFAAQAAGALTGSVIVLFAGLYLAFHPRSYVEGGLLLFPQRMRPRAREVLAAVFDALKRWLLGQLFSMLLVGLTTGAGLALIGAPSAVALGVIAGIAQFVPVIGPMAAVVPGLLVSLEAGPRTFFEAALVYLAASQLEANVITPLVLRRLAQLPMAVTLFAVLAMGVLLGPLGVLFATPLAVVCYVLVKMVYIEGVLGEQSTAGPTICSARSPE